jgi:hypothetical protein
LAEGQQQDASPIPETLREWLRTKVKASVFVARLNVSGLPLKDDDIRAALELTHGEGAVLARAGELLKASPRASPNLQAAIFRFAQKLLEQERPKLSGWLRDEHSTAETDLEMLSAEFAGDLQSKEAVARKRAEALFAIGLAIFAAKRRVAPDVVLRSVAEAYGRAAPPSLSDTRPARAVANMIARSRPRQVLQFAQIAQLYLQRATQAEAREQHALGRAAAAEKDAAERQQRLDIREQELAQARSEIARLEAGLGDAGKRLESAQSVGAHDLAGLRARYRRVLGESLSEALRSALDSLELDPPRPEFAKVYLNEVLQKIEGELGWLNERSD